MEVRPWSSSTNCWRQRIDPSTLETGLGVCLTGTGWLIDVREGGPFMDVLTWMLLSGWRVVGWAVAK